MTAIRNRKIYSSKYSVTLPWGSWGQLLNTFPFLLSRILYQSNYFPERRDYAWQEKNLSRRSYIKVKFIYLCFNAFSFICLHQD